MAHSDRYRLKFSFWLNILNTDEKIVSEQIELLKNNRSFASVCRDGIMLVSELRQGSSGLLVKMFDWLRAPLELYQSLIDGDTTMLFEQFPHTAPQPPSPSPENEELKKRVAILEGQVEILQQVIISQRLPTAIDNAVKMSSAQQPGPKMLTNNNAAPPPIVDDDDDLVIRKDESSGARAAENFIKSAFALNGMTYEGNKQ